jgi:dimethylaniline monooxygenase (N-oxide forming)
MPKRIAVVGAGPSGLVTTKELLAEGHAPVCFEKADGIGGVFRFDETDGVVWESCRLTSSGVLTAFSDFPIPSNRSGHMRIGDYVDYLREYCEKFDLPKHLRFATSVESVSKNLSGDWTLRLRDSTGSREEHFDAVAICSGLHQHPNIPRFAGQETFRGEVIHGAHYRRPSQVSGKRVLIVGAGESGADVTAEVAAHAAETVLSLRRGVAVLPRTIFGKPQDLQVSRLQNSSAHWIFQTRNPLDDSKRRVYHWTFLPFVFIDKFIQLAFRLFWEFLPQLWDSSFAAVQSNLRTRRLTLQLLRGSEGTLNEQFGTKTDEFVRAMVAGRCRLAPAIERMDHQRVVFADHSEFSPDLVVLCTGFETRIPFLDDEIASAPRFLNTFNPDFGADLGFIGFVRPAFGAIPPLAELQARWFALLQSAGLTLPSKVSMKEAIEQSRKTRGHIFRAVKGRLDYLVDFTSACDALASLIGCKPTWRDIRKESPRFRRRFISGPFAAAQYRMIGPHAEPEIARAVIENLPIAHPWPYFANLYLRWTLSRLLHRIAGPAYAPNLELER